MSIIKLIVGIVMGAFGVSITTSENPSFAGWILIILGVVSIFNGFKMSKSNGSNFNSGGGSSWTDSGGGDCGGGGE